METTTKKIRVRLAPSPTGYIHIGTLRTALFDYLLAKKMGGDFVLRIEDTDQNRFMEGSIDNMLKVFKDMHIQFDEGYYLDDENKIQEKGNYGPYLQSKRLDIYHKYAEQLISKGGAYYCFCSSERLDEVHKEQVALKKPPMYDRRCRSLTAEEIKTKFEELKAVGKIPVVRQAMPLDGQTVIHDLIYGDMVYENKLLDDQILLKSDGFPTYHLAVVIDDHLMEISHVIRGEEWVPSTPKHILLYKAFGWEPTLFAHLPLILNADKSKLSKRQGDVAVDDFLKKGYLKDALLNFIAFLGWNPKTEQEIFSIDQLIAEFDLSKVNKAGAVFDINKLDWINGLYIRGMEAGELVNALVPYWREAGIETEKYSPEYLQAIAMLERDRLKKLSEIGERTKYFFQTPEYDAAILVWKKSDAADAKTKLTVLAEFFSKLEDPQLAKEALEEKIKQLIAENNFDNGSVLWPLRVALTGMEKSPGPFEVASTLMLGPGKDEIISRLQVAASKL